MKLVCPDCGREGNHICSKDQDKNLWTVEEKTIDFKQEEPWLIVDADKNVTLFDISKMREHRQLWPEDIYAIVASSVLTFQATQSIMALSGIAELLKMDFGKEAVIEEINSEIARLRELCS